MVLGLLMVFEKTDKLFLGNAQDTVSGLVIKLRTMSMDKQSSRFLQNNS